jgi:PAS domain S-box-containing protein
LEDFEATPSPKIPAGGVISFLAEIVDSSDDAIVSKTLDGKIVSWNRAAERMFGYTAAEAIGQSIAIIIPPERHNEEAEILARIRRGEKVDHFETVRQAKDRRKLDISLTISPIKDSAGHIIGASKVARDITERKRAEREREELLVREQTARRAAQEANRLLKEQLELLRMEVLAREKAQADLAAALKMRDEFIAVAAHELRNPLNILVLTLQLLYRASHDPAGSAQVRSLVGKLKTHLDRLNDLVERLLDVTRIRAGKFELFREMLDVNLLVREVVDRFAEQTSAIRLCVDHESAVQCFCDRLRIDQALTNLISNAIKYGRQRPITVSVSIQDGHVLISVKDQGIGLSRRDLERIFNQFEQGTAAPGNNGLGLGLWITKRIIEAHGGTIEAESEPGVGSVFTIKLSLGHDSIRTCS